MIKLIKKTLEDKFGCDGRVDVFTDDKLELSVRNWGNWELPDDCEDEEDYDWEELSNESYAELNKFMKNISKDFSKYDFDFDIGEKNYIYFRVTLK